MALMMIGTTLMAVTPGYATTARGLPCARRGPCTRRPRDRPRGADYPHPRAAAAGVLSWRRIRQRRQFPRRAWRPAARVQRQLAIRHRWRDHGYCLAVRRRPDVVVDPRPTGQLGMADPLFLWDADWAGRALRPRENRRDPGFHRGREARDDPDQRRTAAASSCGAARARHIDHLEQLLLHLGLYPDLWRQDAAPAGVDRFHGDPGRRPDPGNRLPARRTLVRQASTPPAAHGDHLLAVRADLLPGLLSDGRLALARGLRHCRRVAPISQGRLQRRPAVVVVRAVPGGNEGDRRVTGLQHRGADLRRPRSAGCDMADCHHWR